MHLRRIEKLCVTETPYPVPIRILCCGSSRLRCALPSDAKDASLFIDLDTGRLTFEDETPSAHSDARLRWANTCTNVKTLLRPRRAMGKVFDTRITWRHATDSVIHRFTIRGQQTTCAACPKDSDLIFVGTRTNSAVGKGTLSCLQVGKLLWQFFPTESGKYRSRDNYAVPATLEPYPYRVVCPDDGSYVAFCFLDRAYLLNKSGALLGEWNLHTLIPHEAYHFNDHKAVTTTVIDDGESRLETTDDIFVAPRVQAIACTANGAYLILAVANALFWITPRAEICAQHLPAFGQSEVDGMRCRHFGRSRFNGRRYSRGSSPSPRRCNSQERKANNDNSRRLG